MAERAGLSDDDLISLDVAIGGGTFHEAIQAGRCALRALREARRATLADRVVAHLRATRGQWRVWGSGHLRNRDGYCPIESLRGQLLYRSSRVSWPVMSAADRSPHHDPNLRRRMLRAAGVGA